MLLQGYGGNRGGGYGGGGYGGGYGGQVHLCWIIKNLFRLADSVLLDVRMSAGVNAQLS